jgi:DNA adenine methylase/adenine-specific DNA-methyltransferase
MNKVAMPAAAGMPANAASYPQLRYMGGKHRLLPWLHETLAGLPFQSALDLFSGTGCVSYLLKGMGKRVVAKDFLEFAHHLAIATIENSHVTLSATEVTALIDTARPHDTFIEQTFAGIFFNREDLRFLDVVSTNLRKVEGHHSRALVHASLTRACMKKQPRGVFTVRGTRYDDGRRDLRTPLSEHFHESVALFNGLVFDNGCPNQAVRGDALRRDTGPVDLVYMDPPYVPRADDNCYVKRYHFLEGLASYWRGPGTEIDATSKVRKIAKRFTPFSYRKTAPAAFDAMFREYADSMLVLSYSSNGFPDLQSLVAMMRQYKRRVDVVSRPHRYHFGTHAGVAPERTAVEEYLVVGQ